MWCLLVFSCADIPSIITAAALDEECIAHADEAADAPGLIQKQVSSKVTSAGDLQHASKHRVNKGEDADLSNQSIKRETYSSAHREDLDQNGKHEVDNIEEGDLEFNRSLSRGEPWSWQGWDLGAPCKTVSYRTAADIMKARGSMPEVKSDRILHKLWGVGHDPVILKNGRFAGHDQKGYMANTNALRATACAYWACCRCDGGDGGGANAYTYRDDVVGAHGFPESACWTLKCDRMGWVSKSGYRSGTCEWMGSFRRGMCECNKANR